MSVIYDGKEYVVKREGRLLTLDLSGIGIKKISDIKGLETLNELQALNLNNNQISEVENLENLTNLEDLQLEKNLIENLEGFDNLVNLRVLNLYKNNISEVENFGIMDNLRDIFLAGNPIFQTLVDTVGKVTPQTIEQYNKMLQEEKVKVEKKIQKAERGGLSSERNFMNENSESKPSTIKDKFSASKVVALIGTIFLILYSIMMIISGIVSMYEPHYAILLYLNQLKSFYQVLFGVINLIWAFFLFVFLFEFDIFRKDQVEYHWIPLLILGVLVTFSLLFMQIEYYYLDTLFNNPLGVILYYIRPLPGILLIIAAVLEILTEKKKDINIPKVLSLIGVAITIIGAIHTIYVARLLFSFLSIDYTPQLIIVILAFISVIILIFSMSKINIRIPFNWWVVFIIGIVVIWCSLLGGVVFMCVVIVILLKY